MPELWIHRNHRACATSQILSSSHISRPTFLTPSSIPQGHQSISVLARFRLKPYISREVRRPPILHQASRQSIYLLMTAKEGTQQGINGSEICQGHFDHVSDSRSTPVCHFPLLYEAYPTILEDPPLIICFFKCNFIFYRTYLVIYVL